MIRLRSWLAVRCAQLAGRVIQKMGRGRGGTFPGLVARKIDPDILAVLSGMVREKIIVTMGTNGKTTTNSLLAHALEAEGKKVLINRTGSNMLNGVISAFVLAAGRDGRLDADYACIEVDEFSAVHVFPALWPDCVLLTNIFRDQLDRFGEVDIVLDKICKALVGVPKACLVLNCDDALSCTLLSRCPNPAVTYGISQQIFDDSARSEVRESIFCRHCQEKLDYDFFHYGQLGVWHCPGCGQRRPEPYYTAEQVVFEGRTYTFTLGGARIHSNARAPYNVYNTLSAYAALQAVHAPTAHFREAVERFDYGNGREDIFTIYGAHVELHLAKNPVGFQQKLSLLRKDPEPKDVIIQINDTSQDGVDVSWLWDVDFQYLREVNAATIVVNGTRRYDMGLRLKYEGIRCKAATDIKKAVCRLSREGTGNLYVIVNYSGLYRTRQMLHTLQKEGNDGQCAVKRRKGADRL